MLASLSQAYWGAPVVYIVDHVFSASFTKWALYRYMHLVQFRGDTYTVLPIDKQPTLLLFRSRFRIMKNHID